MKVTLLSNELTAPMGSFYDAAAQADLAASFKRSGIGFEMANVHSVSELESVLANGSDLFWPNMYTFTDAAGKEHWPVGSLERYGVPFVGPGKKGLTRMVEKSLCQSVLAGYGVPIPGFVAFEEGCFDAGPLAGLNYPLIVKPVADCASNGIYADSISYKDGDVARNVQRVFDELHQGAIVEEFLSGTELTVGVVANNDGFLVIAGSYDLERCGVKIRDRHAKEFHVTADAFSLITDRQLAVDISLMARSVYDASGAKEFTRFDCRFDGQGNLKVFDVNGMPGLGIDGSTFPKYFFLANPRQPRLSMYDALVNTIVRGAASRFDVPVPAVIQEKNLFNPAYMPALVQRQQQVYGR